jgi:predicted MFS family arabinose efflux permease
VQTYRELLTVPEFRVLLVSRCVSVLANSLSGLAMGTITYAATGSPVFTALSMFGGPLISLIASHLLLAGSDRFRPRVALMGQVGAPLLANSFQAIPGLPWQVRFALLAVPFAIGPLFAGAQWVVVRQVVPEEARLLARAALRTVVGAMQVVGYGLGGVALLRFSETDLFLAAAAGNLACLLWLRLSIQDRPARGSRAGTLVSRSRSVNRLLLGSSVTRPLYVAMWVPNGLVVGCEALFVPYGDGSVSGYLFAAAAAGMMLGDVAVGRYVPSARRDALIGPLRYLLAVPYLVLLLAPPVAVTVAVTFVASVGYAGSLPLQERLIRIADDEIQGQTMGLYGQGLAVGQAVGALVAGAVATFVSPGHAMGVMAGASIAVTLLNTRGLRRSAPDAAPIPLVSASGSPCA